MQLLKKYCDPAYMCKNQIKNNYTCTPQTAVCETEWGILPHRNVTDNLNIEFLVDFRVMGNNRSGDYLEKKVKSQKFQNAFGCNSLVLISISDFIL